MSTKLYYDNEATHNSTGKINPTTSEGLQQTAEANSQHTYQIHKELLMPLVHDVVVLSTPHKLAQQLFTVLVLQ